MLIYGKIIIPIIRIKFNCKDFIVILYTVLSYHVYGEFFFKIILVRVRVTSRDIYIMLQKKIEFKRPKQCTKVKECKNTETQLQFQPFYTSFSQNKKKKDLCQGVIIQKRKNKRNVISLFQIITSLKLHVDNTDRNSKSKLKRHTLSFTR